MLLHIYLNGKTGIMFEKICMFKNIKMVDKGYCL